MEGLILGVDVYYVLPSGVIRPARVTQIWSQGEGKVNLAVFVDFENDGFESSPIWRTSVLYDEHGEPNTWHWPPKA